MTGPTSTSALAPADAKAGALFWTKPPSTPSIPLFNGDFNYDAAINVDDYGTIDSAVTSQGLPL